MSSFKSEPTTTTTTTPMFTIGHGFSASLRSTILALAEHIPAGARNPTLHYDPRWVDAWTAWAALSPASLVADPSALTPVQRVLPSSYGTFNHIFGVHNRVPLDALPLDTDSSWAVSSSTARQFGRSRSGWHDVSATLPVHALPPTRAVLPSVPTLQRTASVPRRLVDRGWGPLVASLGAMLEAPAHSRGTNAPDQFQPDQFQADPLIGLLDDKEAVKAALAASQEAIEVSNVELTKRVLMGWEGAKPAAPFVDAGMTAHFAVHTMPGQHRDDQCLSAVERIRAATAEAAMRRHPGDAAVKHAGNRMDAARAAIYAAAEASNSLARTLVPRELKQRLVDDGLDLLLTRSRTPAAGAFAFARVFPGVQAADAHPEKRIGALHDFGRLIYVVMAQELDIPEGPEQSVLDQNLLVAAWHRFCSGRSVSIRGRSMGYEDLILLGLCAVEVAGGPEKLWTETKAKRVAALLAESRSWRETARLCGREAALTRCLRILEWVEKHARVSTPITLDLTGPDFASHPVMQAFGIAGMSRDEAGSLLAAITVQRQPGSKVLTAAQRGRLQALCGALAMINRLRTSLS